MSAFMSGLASVFSGAYAFVEANVVQLPILSVMTLFLGAFLVAFLGNRLKWLRASIVVFAILLSFFCVVFMIPTVMVRGQILTYWMGGWTPVSGYAIGIGLEVDQVSLLFALIASTMVLASGLYSFRYTRHDDSREKYYTLYLMLSGSVLGLVYSGDLFNMYVMIEIMTFSAVALTAFRNTYHGALEAAFKYLVVSSVGSIAILTGVALLYVQLHTLNMAQAAALLAGDAFNPLTLLAFALLFTGYAVKAFATPFHPIAADAHATAPSSVSVLISGVLTKMGVYGLIRVCFFVFQCMDLPAMQLLWIGFGCLSMVVCVSMALIQHNFKRLLAFHSISQIGYVLTAVGLSTALGITGGLYHALNHALFKGLLFLCAGAVLYRTGTTDLDKLGGLAKKMPGTCALFLVGAASISGLPPFNGFVSKWYIYQALYQRASETGNIGYAFVLVVALLVSVMTLASFIKVAQSVFFGPLPEKFANIREAPLSMRLPMAGLAILCFVTGAFPEAVTRFVITPAVFAIKNVGVYVDAMMGAGYLYDVAGFEPASGSAAFSLSGAWDPMAWLALFAVLVCAFALFSLTDRRARKRAHAAAGAKYETFACGEENVPTQVGGGDLFWGFRHNLSRYFGFLSDAHTGNVNDYVLWAVTALAAVIVYVFAFVGR